MTGGQGNDFADLGDGNDTFVWNPGDGSDVVEGGAGTDTLVFNGSNANENIDISANGGRVIKPVELRESMTGEASDGIGGSALMI